MEGLKFAGAQVVSQFVALPYPSTDFTGKTVIVTGANVGLGLEAARHFVRLNASKVILGCRSVEKAEAAKANIESTNNRPGVVEVWQVDLGSYESVKEFCGRASKLDRLDVVVENAALSTNTFTKFEEYESTITVNVISTFLMALLLKPTLERTAKKFNTLPHLTIVSSNGHWFAFFKERKAASIFEEFKKPASLNADRYPTSKLLEVFAVRELAKSLSNQGENKVVINMLDPGFCDTQLFRELPWPFTGILWLFLRIFSRSAEMGSRNHLYAASSGLETHGKYIVSCQVVDESPFVRSEEGAHTQKRVWDELKAELERIQPGITNDL